MKAFIVLMLFAATSCHSSKNNAETMGGSSKVDSSIVNGHPKCIDSLIKVFKSEEISNPPRKIYSYTYKNQTVYYVPALCCDFFSQLYDSNCTIIGSPDGGFTGRGDGSMPDFNTARTNEKLIWADERENAKKGN